VYQILVTTITKVVDYKIIRNAYYFGTNTYTYYKCHSMASEQQPILTTVVTCRPDISIFSPWGSAWNSHENNYWYHS